MLGLSSTTSEGRTVRPPGGYADKQQGPVTIGVGFWMAKYELMHDQWMGAYVLRDAFATDNAYQILVLTAVQGQTSTEIGKPFATSFGMALDQFVRSFRPLMAFFDDGLRRISRASILKTLPSGCLPGHRGESFIWRFDLRKGVRLPLR